MDSLNFLANSDLSTVPLEIVEENISDLAFLVESSTLLLSDHSLLTKLSDTLIKFMQHENLDISISTIKTICYFGRFPQILQFLFGKLAERDVLDICEWNLLRFQPVTIVQDSFGCCMMLEMLQLLCENDSSFILKLVERENLMNWIIAKIGNDLRNQPLCSVSLDFILDLFELCVKNELKVNFDCFAVLLSVSFDIAEKLKLNESADMLIDLIDCLCFLLVINEGSFDSFFNDEKWLMKCIEFIQKGKSSVKDVYLKLLEYLLHNENIAKVSELGKRMIDFGLLKYIFPVLKKSKPESELEMNCIKLLNSLLEILLFVENCNDYVERICAKFYEDDKATLSKLVNLNDENSIELLKKIHYFTSKNK